MKIFLPRHIEKIIEILNNAGFEAYAVGGCVRDLCMGKIPHDFDITTNALPKDIKKLFIRTIDTGIRFGTVTVLQKDGACEVTTYRAESEYNDMRRPDKVSFNCDLTEDLKRRDFTVNALCYNPKTGVLDYFDGLSDIKNGVIRAIGNPYERFGEDALRILRAYRFSAKLGFKIEKETEKAIFECSHSVKNISAQRVQKEIQYILESKRPQMLSDCIKSGALAEYLPRGDFDLSPLSTLPIEDYTRYGGLFAIISRDIEKSKMAMDKLKIDNKTKNAVIKILSVLNSNISKEKPVLKRLMRDFGADAVLSAIKIKKALSGKSQKGIEDSANEIIEGKECYRLRDLKLNGNAIINLNLADGAEVGKLLSALLDIVIDNPQFNNKEKLIELAGEMQRGF